MLFLTSVITPPFFLSFLSLLKTWYPLILKDLSSCKCVSWMQQMFTLFSCRKCCSSALLLDTPSAFQCMMFMTGCSFCFELMFFRPVAFLVPLTPQDETKVPPVALVGLLRGREPGTALAWWILTGRAPYRLVVIPSVIMAVNACCCGLLECANYGPSPSTSALRVSVMVTSPLASGIRPFLEAQEGLYRSRTGFILGVFSRSLSHKWACRKVAEVW